MSEEPRFIKTELKPTTDSPRVVRPAARTSGAIATLGANTGEAVVPAAVIAGDLKDYLLSNPGNPKVDLRGDSSFQNQAERIKGEARAMAELLDAAALRVAHRHGFATSPRPGERDFRTSDFMWSVRSPDSDLAQGAIARKNLTGSASGEPAESWGFSLVRFAEGDGEVDRAALLREVLVETGFLGEGQKIPSPTEVDFNGRPLAPHIEYPDPNLPYVAEVSLGNEAFTLGRASSYRN